MSKANRRRQRPGNQSSTSRPTGAQPADQPAPPAAAGGTPSSAASSGAAGTTARPGTPRPTGTGARPPSTPVRHGRRERQRATYKPSFMERYRTALILGAVVLAVAATRFFGSGEPAQNAGKTGGRGLYRSAPLEDTETGGGFHLK